MKRAIMIGFLTVAGLGAAHESMACSCLSSGYQVEFDEAAAVMTARVTRVTPIDEWTRRVDLVVEGVYKGKLSRQVSVTTYASTAFCGFPFKTGEDYLIWANGNEQGELSTSLCSHTAKLSEAKEALDWLGQR